MYCRYFHTFLFDTVARISIVPDTETDPQRISSSWSEASVQVETSNGLLAERPCATCELEPTKLPLVLKPANELDFPQPRVLASQTSHVIFPTAAEPLAVQPVVRCEAGRKSEPRDARVQKSRRVQQRPASRLTVRLNLHINVTKSRCCRVHVVRRRSEFELRVSHLSLSRCLHQSFFQMEKCNRLCLSSVTRDS